MAVFIALAPLGGCTWMLPAPVDPMRTVRLPAPAVDARTGRPARLLLVLPGGQDDLDDLQDFGIAQAVQGVAPDTEVALVGATLPYYMDGGLARRLHEQVIAPARAAGVREIWVSGVSMGGFGALLHERSFPGSVDGFLLMAPFLGDRALIEEIVSSGGLAQWQPGPVPETLTRDSAVREVWRMLKSWREQPERFRRVWLVCGTDDRLLPASRLLAQELPPDHYVERPGGHKWKVWTPAAADVLGVAFRRAPP
ncbi:MAG TPA: alpha/beta hydrolase-fold protein [Nevskiaceae bacterium]|nr:alpha/beta hydrolase-fold protein [Nevskiaceae bacterium]